MEGAPAFGDVPDEGDGNSFVLDEGGTGDHSFRTVCPPQAHIHANRTQGSASHGQRAVLSVEGREDYDESNMGP